MFKMTPDMESLIDRALAEDLSIGDPTTEILIPPGLVSKADLVAKAEGVLAGVDVALAVFRRVDPTLGSTVFIEDGGGLDDLEVDGPHQFSQNTIPFIRLRKIRSGSTSMRALTFMHQSKMGGMIEKSWKRSFPTIMMLS